MPIEAIRLSPDTVKQIIELGLALEAEIERFKAQARLFYHMVMLSEHPCPGCGGPFRMVKSGRCQCDLCNHELDPTVAFQRCPCGGKLRLQVRRYRCARCGSDVPSRFVFDELVFDAEYFRRKMAEARERKNTRRDRVREMLATCRSSSVDPPPIDLDGVPGLRAALDRLVDRCSRRGNLRTIAVWSG